MGEIERDSRSGQKRQQSRSPKGRDSHYKLHYIADYSRASAAEGKGARVPRRVICRSGIWHYYRRVPARFADVDARTFVTISLETRDLARAERLKSQVEKELEAYWVALKKGGSEDIRERYLGAIERARLEGFEYRTAGELAGEAGTEELVARISRIEDMVDLSPGRNEPPTAAEQQTVEVLLGGAVAPDLTLSRAFDEFHQLVRDQVRRKSADQLRRWRAPRLKAIKNLIGLVGDKRIADLTRTDALALKRFWVDRVADDGYTANSANKDIGHLAQMITALDEALELDVGALFAHLRLSEDKIRRRPTLSVDQLRALAVPAALAELNEEARGVVLTMIETGMRPIEICALGADAIVLDTDVPHVRVRPSDERELKTPYSERDIPLVGVSLAALKSSPEGFPRYRDRSSGLSALVNKFLDGHHLLPSDDHSLYSIRHGFQDRLTAADMPDRMQTALMGHKFDRPVYGEGPTLAHKHEWLSRLAIT